MCNVSAISKGGEQFFGSFWGQGGYRQCLWSDAWRNNLVSASRMHSSILKTSEHTTRLNGLWKSPSSRSLSALDYCLKKAGRAYVTTDRTMAVNIICRALWDKPWHFSCCNRYSRWFTTAKVCSTCTVAEKVAEIYTEWAIKTVPYIILFKMLLHLFIWTKWHTVPHKLLVSSAHIDAKT